MLPFTTSASEFTALRVPEPSAGRYLGLGLGLGGELLLEGGEQGRVEVGGLRRPQLQHLLQHRLAERLEANVVQELPGAAHQPEGEVGCDGVADAAQALDGGRRAEDLWQSGPE